MPRINEYKTFDSVDSAIAHAMNWQHNQGATEALMRCAGVLFG